MADVNWNLAVTPDPFKQIAEGRDYSRSVFDQAALLKAGSQYAAGDPASAANTVASRGDFATAGKLQDYATNREAGNLYAGGDYSGAGKALAQGGNLTGAETLADKQIKLVDDQQKALGRSGQFFDAAVKQGLDPVQAWNLVKRQLQSAQIPPDRIADFENIDPAKRGAIMSHIGDQKVEFQKTDDGKLYQFMNGQLVQTYGGDAAFSGKDLIAQAWNIVLDPKADPNSPKYRAAVTELQRSENRYDPNTNTVTQTRPRDLSWLQQQGAQLSNTDPAPPSGTPAPVAPGSDPLPPGVTSRVAPINPPPPPTRRIDRPPVPAEPPPALGAPDPASAATPAVPPQSGPAPGTAPPQQGRTTIYQSPNMTVRQLPPNATNTLDQDSIDNDARLWIASKGTISPQYGAGARAQVQRSAFASAKNRIMKELGVSPEDVASGRASRIADTASLRQLTIMKGAISAYEATARNSAQLALGLLQKGGAQGQSPVINRWIQAGRRSVLGDPDVAVFNNHLDTLADEYGKIMGGGTGSGAATEGARAEAHERINKADNAETITRVIDGLVQEMAGRTRSMDDEIATVKARLSGYGQGAALPAPVASPPQGQTQRGPYAPGRGPQYMATPQEVVDELRRRGAVK